MQFLDFSFNFLDFFLYLSIYASLYLSTADLGAGIGLVFNEVIILHDWKADLGKISLQILIASKTTFKQGKFTIAST